MPQLGSDQKPVLMTNKKNKGRIGKGSRRRPMTISKEHVIEYFLSLIHI